MNAKDGVLRHGPAGRSVDFPQRLQVSHFAMPGDQHNRTRSLSFIHGLLDKHSYTP
jgi:hypothetical protein